MITENERKYLLDSMMKLLDEYGYNYTLHALNSIIDEWASQKSDLIEAFKKHPNYVDGKFLIAFNYDYHREYDKHAVANFEYWLVSECVQCMASTLPDDVKEGLDDWYSYLPKQLSYFVCDIHNLDSRTISKETAELLEEILPQIHPHAGQKTSRVINKLCTYLNYHKHPDYNKEFAKFADALNPLTITRHTVLSINPLDYLTMSFGNSWASCHTIDKENKREMPNAYEGQYSSGTMSYMLDESSMIFYTVDKKYDGTDYWTQPKINRQMFHYGEEKLVQGRLYPQDYDDDGGAYTPNRQIVQGIMSVILDTPNLWSLHKGVSASCKYIVSEGTHYRDYNNFDNCSLSRIKGSENENTFIVGATPICIECGSRHHVTDNINHCAGMVICNGCGKQIDEDDACEIDGQYYCDDCIALCHDCNEYHLKEDCVYLSYCRTWVCKSCLDDDYFMCEECGEYHRNRDAVWCEEIDADICRDCARERNKTKQETNEPKIEIDKDRFKRILNDWYAVSASSRYFVIDDEEE